MVVNANNTGGYKSHISNTHYTNGDSYKRSQLPQTYNNSWHVGEPIPHGTQLPVTGAVTGKEETFCCKCLPKNEQEQTELRYSNCPQSTANMVASYGVYYDSGLRSEDEAGFVPRSNAYRGIVVNASGGTSVLHTAESANDDSDLCVWCMSNQLPSNTATNSWWISWCKPTVLLLLLVLLVVLFVLVSGILLYFNYASYKPRSHPGEEPCEKTFCNWGAQCSIGSDGRPFCQCPSHCKQFSDPVCGTDGKTYENECQLQVASCRARLNTKTKYAGECEQNDPCQDRQCGFGARCIPTPDGHNYTCQCPEKCPNYGDHITSRPVCGSNGVDYKDQCDLQKNACTTNTNITLKFFGKCDPCAGVECAEPEICQLDEHRNPVCRCGESCPLEFTPVCGSDGKTYQNECLLRQEACRARRTLNIIYRGKCSSGCINADGGSSRATKVLQTKSRVNPCTSVECVFGEECMINKYGIARCECPPQCERVMRPVCSKDGRTFPSECEMKRSACLTRATIEIAYTGVCGDMGPCTDHECPFGAACVERSNVAHCECSPCPEEFQPVCGSDGISYGNRCKLRLEACKHRREIKPLYDGPCNDCENKKCEFYAVCETDGGSEGRCVCPLSCKSDVKLVDTTVCGTDGITYPNECQLRISSCKTKQNIVVAYKGNCDLCQGVQCKFGARCEAGECICPTNCEGSGDEPVCASNMITYPSECELQKAACLLLSTKAATAPLSVVFYGDCRERFPLTFTTFYASTVQNTTETGIEIYTGATDSFTGLTGSDRNAAEKEACRDIHCDFEATCELGPDNFPRCMCQFDCSDIAVFPKPVCASDLRIYSSLCAMKMEACQRQEELRLRPLELCQGMEVKPCNGEVTLIDPNTGRELDCGNGPNRQDCPSGSYCHQTTRFARCCHKDQTHVQQKSCEDSWFGCCPDNKTPAKGADFAGCPSLCGCNKLGSYSDTCDPETKECRCKPGVGGAKCDRCEPGYWGLPKISSGHQGCTPCGCSSFGSVRDDCEQMTGRCVCKPGIQGQKCTVCTSHDKVLGPNGCVPVDLSTPSPTSCDDLTCHFGAICIEKSGIALCECHGDCSEEIEAQIVCGSDGQTYSSACQLRLIACKLQKDIVVQAFGTCKEDMFASTDWPVRRYTPVHFTQPDDSNSPLSKSTRHLAPDTRYYYERSGSFLRQPQRPDDSNEDGGPANNPSATGSESNLRGRTNAASYVPTPATVRVTALLGDLCSDDNDCFIKYSTCIGGACICLPKYSESPDRQECIGDTAPTDRYRPCSSSPCHQSGTCLDLSTGTFACVCPENYTGQYCQNEIIIKKYEVAAFDGRSYIRMRPLKAYHKLSVEIEFKTYTKDGIILYNQQRSDGLGDFVSLAIIKGYVEFRYNLGNGPIIITSSNKVHLNRFHRVIVKRYHRDGMLKLDEGEDMAGQSTGSLKALDLVEDAFVGYVPLNSSKVFENIGTNVGLHGCVRKLRIGRKTVELHEGRDEWVVRTEGIRECDNNPCSSSPCVNGGTCKTVDTNEVYRCECSDHYTGDLCQDFLDPCLSNPCGDGMTCVSYRDGKFSCSCPVRHVTGMVCRTDDATIPQFDASAFIEYPPLKGINKAFKIEIVFLTKSLNGLILYSGQSKNGKGDFISLNLIRGYLQFRFNLGSGIANITSKETIAVEKWYTVNVMRNGREGGLRVNNDSIIRGESSPPLSQLNIDLPLYIGSPRSWQEVHRLSAASKGFKGAIQRISVNDRILPLSASIVDCSYVSTNKIGCGHKLTIYDGDPCPIGKNPCKNGGLCIPNVNEYDCKCETNYKGDHCEYGIDESLPVKFTGTNYYLYRYPVRYHGVNGTNGAEYSDYLIDGDLQSEGNSLAHNDDLYVYYDDNENNFKNEETNEMYEIRVNTWNNDGLILWKSANITSIVQEQYLAIAITDGYPEISYNSGSIRKAFKTVRAKTTINDGKWHVIRVKRKKRIVFISVDGKPPINGIPANEAKSSNGGNGLGSNNSDLWLGSNPFLPRGLPVTYYKGFVGCIEFVKINNQPLDMVKILNNERIRFCHDNEI